MKRKSISTPDMSDEEHLLPVFENPERKVVESSSKSFDFSDFDQKLASIHLPKEEETIKGKSSSNLFDPVEKIPDFTFIGPKELESMKGKSSSTFFGSEGTISESTFIKLKGESVEGKPSSTYFGSEGKIPDFDFFEPKAMESIEGKSSSTFSGSEGNISDFNFIKPKAEPIEGKSSSTFLGSEAKISDFTFMKPKAEIIEGKSSPTFFGSEGKKSDCTLSEPKGVESMVEKSSSSSGGSYDVVLDLDNRQDNVVGSILIESLRRCTRKFEINVSKPDVDVLEVGVTGKVFIPVFSKGFASNESCLQNLVSMVDRRSYSATNHILPIFLGVEPSDVRLDTPLYQQDLDKLRSKFDDMVVKRWTAALIDVSNISGQFIPESAGPHEIANLMKEVCQMVLDKLRLSQLSKGTYFVEMNQHVESIIDMLNLGVNDVEVISISGAKWVGKTTLARAVYDKLSSSFEGCSFLSRSREEIWIEDDIKNWQAKLVSDLLKREVEVFPSVDEGRDLIRERFCHMKVLVVLDDVWESHVEALVGELNWFGPGSRIIITKTSGVTFSTDSGISSYRISTSQLGLYEGVFDLFKYHAFLTRYPFPDFHALSQQVSRAITRLGVFSPLHIEVVGSFLYGKSPAEWESMLLHLRHQDSQFFKDLRGMLRMSYESLTENQKQIFLDVSCLPDGMDRRSALLLWDDYLLHSQSYHDFEVLIRLSLVNIDANDGIWMHRIVRYFGRNTIMDDPRRWPTDKIGLARMRFFKMVRPNISSIHRFCQQLRDILCESQFPNSVEADHHAKRLKVFDLSWSKITEKWETWHQIQAPQLRVLNLTGCVELMVTPSFSFCPNLEMLILEHCSRLVEIDPSIQVLQKLATLNLRYCMELSVLPKEIGCLNALKELLMDGTSIQEIPVSIGHLTKLQVLTAVNCSSLTQLPSSTCNLLFITALKLDYAKITELPCSILQTLKLQYLSLRDCQYITNLGSFVGEVERSLIELDVSGTSISELPKSISKLRNLRVLKMDMCFIREFPPGFGKLKKLKEVHAFRCKRLESLPHDIGGVESLQILKVGHSGILGLPQSIQLLEHLEVLDCTSCNKLQDLPKLPSSLTSLYVQSVEFKELPNLHDLLNLKEFTLGNNTPQAKKLTGFPPFLRKLTLQCTNLGHMASLPSTLVVMSIQNSRFLKKFPSVESLQTLQEMEVMCCPEIKKIEGLGRLKALKILTVSDCGIKLLDGLGELFSLRRLVLQDCRSLRVLPNLKRLTSLLEMKIIGCSEIKGMAGLWGLQNLQVLSISNCGIRSLVGLDKLNSLTRLTITDCVSLRRLPDLSGLWNLNEKCVLLEDPE